MSLERLEHQWSDWKSEHRMTVNVETAGLVNTEQLKGGTEISKLIRHVSYIYIIKKIQYAHTTSEVVSGVHPQHAKVSSFSV